MNRVFNENCDLSDDAHFFICLLLPIWTFTWLKSSHSSEHISPHHGESAR